MSENAGIHELFPPPDDGRDWKPVLISEIGKIMLFSMDSGEPVWLGSFTPTELPNEEAVRTRYGGGRFQVKAQAGPGSKQKVGTWLGARTWRMEGARRSPPESAAAAPSAAPLDGVVDRLAHIFERHSSAVAAVAALGATLLEGRREDRREERRRDREAAERSAEEMRTLVLSLVGSRGAGAGEQINAELLRTLLAERRGGGGDINADLLRHALEQRGAASPIDQIRVIAEVKKLLKADEDIKASDLMALAPMVLGMLRGGGAPPDLPPLPPAG